MAYELLKIEKRENGVAVVTMNQPETLNALGVGISRELRCALTELEEDQGTRVIVLKGAGRAFSSGGNLKDMHQSLSGDAGKYMDELTREVYAAVDKLMVLDKPVIAAVHGFAYGAAFNLVLACDLAVCAEGTVFCESFIRLGLIPGGHATTLLPRIVGMRRATELCLTGRDVSAEEALIMGLVNMVVPEKELMEHALKMADKLAETAPLAVRRTKKLLRAYYENTHEQQAEQERRTQIRMASTRDFAEGVTAFVEKRKPKFVGE
ncbi:MAG TPA: enoyl-CoA hydratase/isomerase family protein [bacterium]|nr:enoyl-CoA hydratase/isomerase family protein [bacterium]